MFHRLLERAGSFADVLQTYSPGTPKLSLELVAPSRVSRTVPFDVSFILKTEESCSLIIDWTPLKALNNSQFVLLHKKETGAEICHVRKCDVKGNPLACPYSEVLPGKGASETRYFGSEYHSLLEVGDTYIFFWPGAEIRSWERNAMMDHLRKMNCAANMSDAVPIILPASNTMEFTIFEEPEPWPEREAWERIDGFWATNLKEKNWRKNRRYRARTPVPKVLTQADRE